VQSEQKIIKGPFSSVTDKNAFVQKGKSDGPQTKTNKRDDIYAAFAKLLSKEPYSAITVKEIIDLANVGRSTFYSHFETKDDLLASISDDLFEHVFITQGKGEATPIATPHPQRAIGSLRLSRQDQPTL
jgi:AcrR family transcriptional regulator